MPEVSEKLKIQTHENAQTEGRTKGTTLFYWTLLATARGPKRICGGAHVNILSE